jgi:hypothetical protein
VPEDATDGAIALAYTSFSATSDAVEPRVVALAQSIIKALIAGNGRSGLCDSEAVDQQT